MVPEAIADLEREQRASNRSDRWLGRRILDLGGRLQREGRFAEAVEAHREAVAVLRSVVEPPTRPPSLFARVFAKRSLERPTATDWEKLRDALLRLSVVEHAADMTAESLATKHRVIGVDRRILELRGGTAVRVLATDLSNLAWSLEESGATDEALDTLRESAAVYRSMPALETCDVEAFSGLLVGMHRLLGERGLVSEAVEVATEALALLDPRALVERSYLLGQLTQGLHQLGRLTEACEAAEHAVDTLRKLSNGDTDEYAPRLALALRCLGIILTDVERAGEGAQATLEAVEIHRELTRTRPAVLPWELADALAALANQLDLAGREEDALETTREDVEVRRGLVDRAPGDYTEALAVSTHNLAVRAGRRGRHAEAKNAASESIALFRRVGRSPPESLEAHLAFESPDE